MERIDGSLNEFQVLDFDDVLADVQKLIHPVEALPLGDEEFADISHVAITSLVTLSQQCCGQAVLHAIYQEIATFGESLTQEDLCPAGQMKMLDLLDVLRQAAALVLVTVTHTNNLHYSNAIN